MAVGHAVNRVEPGSGLAAWVLQSRRRGQHARIRIAVRAVNGIGWRYTRKPLNQRFILWMEGESIGGDWNGCVGKAFNHVTGFQVVLAEAVGRLPPWSGIVHERIIECFRELMAQSGDVNKAAAKDPGIDPAGIVHDVTLFTETVHGAAWLHVIGMEAKNTAICRAAIEEENVREKERGHVPGGDIAGVFRCAHHRGGVSGGGWK